MRKKHVESATTHLNTQVEVNRKFTSNRQKGWHKRKYKILHFIPKIPQEFSACVCGGGGSTRAREEQTQCSTRAEMQR